MGAPRQPLRRLALTCHLLQFILSVAVVIATNNIYNAVDIGLMAEPYWAAVPLLIAGIFGTVILIIEHYKEVVFSLFVSCLALAILLLAIVFPASKIDDWDNSGEALKLNLCVQEERKCNCMSTRVPETVYDCDQIGDIRRFLGILVAVCSVAFVICACAVIVDALICLRWATADDSSPSEEARFATPASLFSEEDIYLPGEVFGVSDSRLLDNREDEIAGVAMDITPSKEELMLQSRTRGSRASRLGADSSEPYVTHKMTDFGVDMMGATVPDQMPKIEDDVPDKESLYDWKQGRDSATWQRATYSRDSARAVSATDAVLEREQKNRPRTSSARLGAARPAGSTRRDKLLRRLESTSGNTSPDEDVIERDAMQKTSNSTPNSTSSSRRRVPLPLHLRERLGVSSEPPSPRHMGSSLPNIPMAGQTSTTPRTAPASCEITNEKLPAIGNPHELHQEEEFWNSSSGNHFHDGNRHSYERLELSSSSLRGKETTERVDSAQWNGSKEREKELHNGSTNGTPSGADSQSETSERSPIANGIRNREETESVKSHPYSTDENTKGSQENMHAKQEQSENASENSSSYDDKSTAATTSEEARSKRKWHPPWQLKKEILGHTNAIPTLCLEPTNRWFASGSADKTIKVWDLEDATLRLNVKAHKGGVRATTFGTKGHRFLFSAGDDRQLLCTDIEVNRIVTRYPEQTSVIYDLAIYYPTELLLSCGRDKHIKLWDIRTQKCVKTLKGHYNTVSCLATLDNTRQIVSGSHDKTLRIWDIGEGRCTQVLTGHQKSLRSVSVHDSILSSASTERIRHWQMPQGMCIKETDAEDMSINCISVSPQGVLVAAGSNGVIHLWDWKTGFKFQKIHRTSVYESQEIPICVFCAKFDSLGNKLLISDASNVIKIYKEAYTKIRRRNIGREDSSGTYQTLFGKRSSNPSLAQLSM